MPLIKRKFKFNLTKLLSSLKTAEIRTRQTKNRTDNSIPLQISGIETSLRKKDIEDAKIKTEVLIKSERLSVALDELDDILLKVAEGINLLVDPKSIPDDFLATLSVLLYAVPRMDIKELNDIKKHLKAKLGKEFVKEAMGGSRVDPLVAEKFRLDVPSPVLVGDYLESIASAQKKPLNLNLPSVPTEKVSAKSSALKFPEVPRHEIKTGKDEKAKKAMEDSFILPVEHDDKDTKDDDLPSFEELLKRFDELKKN